MQKVEIFNNSPFPVLVEKKGTDKIVLHPGKKVKVNMGKAEELMSKNKDIVHFNPKPSFIDVTENKESLTKAEREEMKDFTKESKKKKNKDD